MLEMHAHFINFNGSNFRRKLRYKNVLAKKDRAEAREIH
jgi:hypothetical protein